MKTRLLLTLFALGATVAFAAEKARPLKALLVTGGCCHDYTAQKKIIPEGVTARANVEWTIVHEGGDTRDHRVSIYENADWAKGYDVVVHNECFGHVNDAAFVERIAAPHKAGVPAVFLHCSSHSYRMAPTDAWREIIGIKSMSHEKRRDLMVESLKTKHPVMVGFPDKWPSAQDECYKNEQVWPTVTALAKVYGEDTKKDHVVIWVNTLEKTRTFTTTLGHSNPTMESPVYLDLVARGLLWVCGKLNDDGTPKRGYGAGGK
jgi:type 1 glutamine amidotransferase